jgi:hypothetical protein
MNLVAKIKRLELEAAERDKRIAALEARVMDQPFQDEEAPKQEAPAVDAPKKRKARAKTYGTE